LKEKICFVVSSHMTINAFLRQPIERLSEYYDIYVALDINADDNLRGLESLITVVPIKIKRKISLLRDLIALWQLIRLFNQYDFNIVHSVTPKAGLLAMLAAVITGVKVRIHTFTGQVWATKTGLARMILKGFDKLIVSFSTHVLVDSPSQRQFLLNEGVVGSEKSNVLLKGSISGVDLSKFKMNDSARARIREACSISDSDVVFLYIGRLNRDKGILDLVVAFTNLARKHKRARLLIVGLDEENLLVEMRKIIRGIEKQVNFVDFTPVPEEYMAASDVLCLPSYREGFGNVIVEAAAVGIPTLGSRIYGVTDAVVEGETGLLFDARDIIAIELCMENILINKQLRTDLGMAAHTRVSDYFSSQKLSEAWLKYYQELP